jgi:hypothetical protein
MTHAQQAELWLAEMAHAQGNAFWLVNGDAFKSLAKIPAERPAVLYNKSADKGFYMRARGCGCGVRSGDKMRCAVGGSEEVIRSCARSLLGLQRDAAHSECNSTRHTEER